MELKFEIGEEVFVIKSRRGSLSIRKATVKTITINDRGARYHLKGVQESYNEKETDIYNVTPQTQALYDEMLVVIRTQNPDDKPDDVDIDEDEFDEDEPRRFPRSKVASSPKNY